MLTSAPHTHVCTPTTRMHIHTNVYIHHIHTKRKKSSSIKYGAFVPTSDCLKVQREQGSSPCFRESQDPLAMMALCVVNLSKTTTEGESSIHF